MREINQASVDLIKSFEGIEDGDPRTANLDPYADMIGVWTIGYGHAITFNGRQLRGTQDKALAYSLYPKGITMPQAEALLKADAMDKAAGVQALLSYRATDNQFGALVSFAFNLGVGSLRSSTLLRFFNAGDIAAAANEFPRWNRAGGVITAGLTRRRLAEKALFLKP